MPPPTSQARADRPRSAQDFAAPEHLDRALYVATPKGWLALLTLMAMMGAVVAWAALGEVATYVHGDGIVMGRGGTVFDAASPEGGRLVRIAPSLGDPVSAGDVVAEIENLEITERYANALALAEERMRTLRDREAEAREENALLDRHMAQQRANLDMLERTGRELIETAGARLLGNSTLFEEGLVARTEIEENEEAVDLARRNLVEVLRRRDDLASEALQRRNGLRIRVDEATAQLLEAQRQVKELETRIEMWRIRTPVSGRVTEIKAQVGEVLQPGESVLGIRTGNEGLDVLIYVTTVDGKRVEPGMPARVSPNTVRHVEYGYMTGVVESISEFPASIDSMAAVLQNEELAETFARRGTPYVGRVALTPDPTSASGFAWTSARGAEVHITAGTVARVEIEVERQPPIALVIPLVKEGLGY